MAVVSPSAERPAIARIGGLLVAVALVAVLPFGASADTRRELEATRARIAGLQGTIAAQKADAAGLRFRISALTAQIGAARAAYERTRGRLAQTRASIRSARRELTTLRRQLGRRMAAAYVSGPAVTIEVLLGASSLSDLASRLEFADRVTGHDSALVTAVDRQAELLSRQRRRLQAVASEQARRLESLSEQQKDLDAALAERERTISELVAARLEAFALAEDLERRLRAERRAASRRATSFTLGEWAGYFLPRIGAPGCGENMVLVVSWEVAEYTAARFNPLATTYAMPGATDFNGHGVKNYVSLDQGLQASVLTLGRPGRGYEAIVSNLRACSDAGETAGAIDRSAWCGGCQGGYYVRAFVPIVRGNYSRYANARPPS